MRLYVKGADGSEVAVEPGERVALRVTDAPTSVRYAERETGHARLTPQEARRVGRALLAAAGRTTEGAGMDRSVKAALAGEAAAAADRARRLLAEVAADGTEDGRAWHHAAAAAGRQLELAAKLAEALELATREEVREGRARAAA